MKTTGAVRFLPFMAMAIFFIFTGCVSLGAINIPVEQLKKEYGKPEDRYISINGQTVRYRDEGKGPVLVLLHGVCSSLEAWDGWVSRMKGRYRVIRMDMPGFGITGPAKEKWLYSRDGAVAALNSFVNELGLQSFSLAGNSLGGYICWNYALDYPGRVEKLILIDPAGYNWKMPYALRLGSNPVIRPAARSMMPRSFFYKAARQVYGDKTKVTLEIQKRYFDFAMREGNKRAYVDIFAEIRRLNNTPGMGKEIPNIKVKTLVMWGTKDEWIPIDQFDRWKKDLPQARFIAYEGAGHVPMEEIPEKTSADAMDFLK